MSKYLLKSTVDTYPRPATVIAASPICGYMLAGGADRSGIKLTFLKLLFIALCNIYTLI